MTSLRHGSHYDVIVAGLGAMGSATIAHLAQAGQRVLGLDRWTPGHRHGSSHGDSRIIREMYFEHPMYVPLLQRAYELWALLGDQTGTQLLHMIGGLMIGREDGQLVKGVLRSAKTYGLPYDLLAAREVADRFPAFALRDDLIAVLDPRAGYLDPEACNAAHLEVARANGAELRFDEMVTSWESSDSKVTVSTVSGRYTASRMVITAGARIGSLLNGLAIPVEVERQTVFWFEPESTGGQGYDEKSFPIWAYEYEPGEICYGFPRLPRGVKASIMHSGQIISDADDVERNVRDEEADPLRAALGSVLPGIGRGRIVERDVCLFTNTADHDFIIDFHPDHPRVIVSSACSGHGFKFATVIGEIQAGLATDGGCNFDISPFRLGRPAPLPVPPDINQPVPTIVTANSLTSNARPRPEETR